MSVDCLARIGSVEELWGWVRQNTGMRVPRVAVCPHHQAPMDYLAHAYFDRGDAVVWAPRGGGKTLLGAIATLLDLLHKPGCHVRILGGSLEQSLRMWEHLAPLLEQLGGDELRIKARRAELPSGSSAAVLTQSQRSVRGLHVQKVRCDEVEMFDPRVWEAAQLVPRTRRLDDGALIRGSVEAISTFHAPLGLMRRIVDAAPAAGRRIFRWCILEVLERCPPERDCASCVLNEECGGVAKTRCDGFLSIDDAIVMKHRVSRETWEAEMLCLRPHPQQRVFPSFSPAIHVREDLPAAADVSLGMDFGFSSPFACLWIARAAGDVVYVVDEYIVKSRTMLEHIAEIASRQWTRPGCPVFCDPAGNGPNHQTGHSDVAFLRKAGYRVKSRGSRIDPGLEMIRAALRPAAGPPRLFIHPRCQKLISALENYRYADNGSENPLKEDDHDHPIDALRYWFINNASSGVVKVVAY